MSGILKEGYLVKSPDVSKYLHNTKKWQRKWFTLDSSGELLCYDSDKSTKITGAILPIPTCSLIFDPKVKGIQFGFCIGLEFRDSTLLYLKAESAQIFNEWLTLLRTFAEKCDLEELPDRHSTMASVDQFGARSGSVTSVQTRQLRPSVKSRFQRKEGIMSKTGGNNKGWKERYFVLNNGKLSYYKNDKSLQSALGTIDLFECLSVSTTAGKKGFGLDLHTPSRVFNLSTETAVEQSDWLAVFTHTLKVIRDIKDSPVGGVPSVIDIDRRSVGSDYSLEKSTGDDDRVTSTDLSLDSCIVAPPGKLEEKQEDKDGVVPLLEAEVEALHSKVSSLEADLRSSGSVNGQLQRQLVEERGKGDKEVRTLRRAKEDLEAQTQQLEKTKEELEAVNDSIQTQLEEEQEKNQVLEDNVIAVRHELDEQQIANTTMEEELFETQTKLQEIQEVAQELEVSLRKRSDSEPPDPSSIRSLNLSYQAKMEEKEKRDGVETPSLPRAELLDEDPIGGRVSNELIALKDKVSSLEKEKGELAPLKDKVLSLKKEREELLPLKDKVKSLEKERELLQIQLEELRPSSSAAQSEKMQSSSTSEAVAVSEEERLKWQVEMSNIRREMEGKLEAERKRWEGERRTLKQELAKLRGEVSGSRGAAQQFELLHAKLDKSNHRVNQLEGEVKAASERATQLLAEKEKALSDLKTIRKANRTIEKKLSESEDLRKNGGSPLLSASPNSSIEHTSPLPMLEEANEKKLGELKLELEAVQKERNQLRVELDTLKGRERVPSGGSASRPFNFLGKAGPTLGTTNQLAVNSAQAPPTSTGLVSNQSNDQPPPKPRKPPRELVNRFNQSSSPVTPRSTSLKLNSVNMEQEEDAAPENSIRSRTATMLQVLFARR